MVIPCLEARSHARSVSGAKSTRDKPSPSRTLNASHPSASDIRPRITPLRNAFPTSYGQSEGASRRIWFDRKACRRRTAADDGSSPGKTQDSATLASTTAARTASLQLLAAFPQPFIHIEGPTAQTLPESEDAIDGNRATRRSVARLAEALLQVIGPDPPLLATDLRCRQRAAADPAPNRLRVEP